MDNIVVWYLYCSFEIGADCEEAKGVSIECGAVLNGIRTFSSISST